MGYQHFFLVFQQPFRATVSVRRRGHPPSIQIQKFIPVPHTFDKPEHVVATYHQRSRIIVGMETDLLGIKQLFVDKQNHRMFHIVYQCEQRHRARHNAQILHHPLGRSERQFALVQPVLNVVDIHAVAGIHYHQIVLVAFVVAEKQILAQHRALPPIELRGNLYSGGFGVLVIIEGDAELVQIVVYLLLSPQFMMPNFFDMSSIRTMGRAAASMVAASSSISGVSSRMHKYSFSRVFCFMYEQSAQLHC